MIEQPDVGRIVIGIGGIAVARGQAGQIITHALGSCLGLTMWDPRLKLGGMLHAQLPQAPVNVPADPERRALYIDVGLNLLLREMERQGADRKHLRLTLAGGASLPGLGGGMFNIGARNLTMMRKLLWQERLLLAGEETGGADPRTMTLHFSDGSVHLSTAGRSRILA